MKMSRVFAAALLAVSLYPVSSQAALVNITSTSVSPGSYEITGTLDPSSTATFQLTAAGLNPSTARYSGYVASLDPTLPATSAYNLGTGFVSGNFGGSPSSLFDLSVFYPTSGSPSISSAAVVAATANLADPFQENLTLSNFSSTLSAGFQALVAFTPGTQIGSVQLLSASAVPLPASLFLFLTGLMALAGFGLARKSRAN